MECGGAWTERGTPIDKDTSRLHSWVSTLYSDIFVPSSKWSQHLDGRQRCPHESHSGCVTSVWHLNCVALFPLINIPESIPQTIDTWGLPWPKHQQQHSPTPFSHTGKSLPLKKPHKITGKEKQKKKKQITDVLTFLIFLNFQLFKAHVKMLISNI